MTLHLFFLEETCMDFTPNENGLGREPEDTISRQYSMAAGNYIYFRAVP